MTGRQFRRTARLGFLLLLAAVCQIGIRLPTAARTVPASASRPSAQQGLSSEGEALLRELLNSAEMPDLYWPGFANYQVDAKEFYGAFNDSLPWIDHGKPTAQALAITRLLKNADDKGLRSADYDASKWDGRLAQFDASAGVTESNLVRFDLAVTISTMRYISDLHVGRVNPHLFHFGLDIDHKQMDLSEFLRVNLVRARDMDAAVEAAEPPFPIYRRTEAALRNYREFVRRDDRELLPASARNVAPGDFYPGTPRLARLLALLGDFPENQPITGREARYQGPPVEGVKHFQRRHGLVSNGIIDAATRRQLNTPLSRRVVQLQLAMERMRWLPHDFAQPPIVVNIPEYRLYAINEQYSSAFTMNVIVGRAYGHQTPVFANEIESVIVRPYWNVPASIARLELIPHLENDPSYFSKNSYEVVDRNEKIVGEGPISKETRNQIVAGGLRVRQTPGPGNALSLLKFEFPNRYDVYMHGTPSTQLFSRSRRDFSHGCIRVEDPVALAKWVLRGMPEWTEERIRNAMNDDETIEVRLKEPIPVLILYSTAVVLEGNEVRFLDDIYGLDADLERALTQDVP
jgi:L,D-transpeptidase YcbB